MSLFGILCRVHFAFEDVLSALDRQSRNLAPEFFAGPRDLLLGFGAGRGKDTLGFGLGVGLDLGGHDFCLLLCFGTRLGDNTSGFSQGGSSGAVGQLGGAVTTVEFGLIG
jgi:hypothetical protein